MKKNILSGLVAVLIILGFSNNVGAVPGIYEDFFPSDKSTIKAAFLSTTGDAVGYFFTKAENFEHGVSQTFYDTGLVTIDEVDLHLFIATNTLWENFQLDWDFYINDINVYSWTWYPETPKGYIDLSFTFSDILGTGNGDYKIDMLVSNEVTFGRGSIGLRLDNVGTLKLHGDTGAYPIPEPSTIILLGTGIIGLFSMGLKKKDVKKSYRHAYQQ